MRALPRALVLALVGALSLVPTRSPAAPGPLVGWGSSGETGFQWDATRGRSLPGPSVSESNMRGWVGISLAGQLADSRWLTWAWSARPGFVRSGGSSPGSWLETSELAHQFTAGSQPWPWLRAQLTADRDRIVANRGEEASRESRLSHAEGRADVRASAFSLGVLSRRERSDDRWMATAVTPELERHVDRRAFEAWLESSKLRLAERRTRESSPGASGEVRTTHTTLDHTLRWGRGSRLATSLEWNDQSPRTATIVDRAVEERLHLRHTSALSSDYRFHANHARLLAGEGTTRSHHAEFAARSDGVGLALGGGVRDDRSPGREGRAWSIGPRVFAQRASRSGLRLSAQAGASLERERRTGANDARLAVTGETHRVGPTRSFTLAVEGVDSATVVVRDANGVSGYVVGLDWDLVRAGTRTSVVIPLGSRIAVGDVLLVTYEATPPGVPSRRSTRLDLGVGAEWRGVSLRLEDLQTVAEDAPRDRGARGLGQREQVATLAALVPRGALQFDASATERKRVVEGQSARVEEARVSLGWRWSPAWRAAGEAAVSQSLGSGGRLGSTVKRLSVEWSDGGAWRWSAHLDGARFDRSGASAVTQRLAGTDVTARWGRLDASLRADVGDRRGGPGHRFSRASLSVRRRLR